MDKKNDFRRWVGGKKNEFRWFYTPLNNVENFQVGLYLVYYFKKMAILI